MQLPGKQTEESISAIAAAITVAMGFMPVGFAWVGHESHCYVFHSKDGTTGYFLEGWGNDNPFLGVSGYSANFIITEDHIENGFLNKRKQPKKIWNLDFEGDPPPQPVTPGGTDFAHIEGLSIGNEMDGEDMGDWNAQHLNLWMVGALSAFLYDLREGKVS